MKDLIIIGAGPVGIYGAFYATLNKLNVLILEIDSQIGGAPKKIYPEKNLYDVPGFISISGGEYTNLLISQLKTKSENWELIENCHIVDIKQTDDNLYQIYDSHGRIHITRHIIFSTGYGSFKFKTIDESKILTKNKQHIHHVINDINMFNNLNIVICGAGNTAIDYGMMLANKCKSIKLIHHSDQFKAMQQNVEKLKNLDNVQFFLNSEIIKVEDHKITIKQDNKQHIINYDELFIFYGIEPISHQTFFKLPFFNNQQKIEVSHNNYESVNFPGIYACGAANQFNLNNLMLHGFSQIAIAIDDISKKQKK